MCQSFFLNYRKTITPLTSHDNSKKTDVRKPKMLLDIRLKKKELIQKLCGNYTIQKHENLKSSFKH
jgi:hypothetical protein